MNIHQIADRIRSGNPLIIGDAVYSMTRVRERAEESANYQAALHTAATAKSAQIRMIARQKAAEIWDKALMDEAADAMADYKAFPNFLKVQAA